MTDPSPAPEQKPPAPPPVLSLLRPYFAPAASVALAASQLPWLYVAVQQFRSGAAPLGAWNLVVCAVILFLAWGLWRRDARSYGPAQVAAWYDLLFSAFWAHSQEAPFLWTSAALGLVAAFAVSAARDAVPGARPARPASSESLPLGPWVKENIEAIVVAFIMALVIRCFCIEVFKIPSSSMEPTLLGDVGENHSQEACSFGGYHGRERGGDRIMVTKYYYAFTAIERFDVVVFKFPLNQAKNFIKRVVGLPGEEIMIHRGNLYTRAPGSEGKFRIARRTTRTQDSIWIEPKPYPDRYLARFQTFEDNWEAADSHMNRAGFVVHEQEQELVTQQNSTGQRSVTFKYTPASNLESSDLRLAFEFELTHPKGEVFGEIANEHGRFRAILSTDGASELIFTAPGGDKTNVTLKGVHLALDRRYRFDLTVFDGVAVVRVEGEEAGRHPFLTEIDDPRKDKEERPPSGSERAIAFGSRDATFRVRNLRIGRDISYQGREGRDHGLREDEPFTIGPGKYLMMGDNVANSHDSRAWTLRQFVLKDTRRVRAEAQEVKEVKYNRELIDRLVERYKLTRDPDIFIENDEHGDQWAIYESAEGLPVLPPTAKVGVKDREEKAEPYRGIDERYIVGKALWIWWPPNRWFRLIR